MLTCGRVQASQAARHGRAFDHKSTRAWTSVSCFKHPASSACVERSKNSVCRVHMPAQQAHSSHAYDLTGARQQVAAAQNRAGQHSSHKIAASLVACTQERSDCCHRQWRLQLSPQAMPRVHGRACFRGHTRAKTLRSDLCGITQPPCTSAESEPDTRAWRPRIADLLALAKSDACLTRRPRMHTVCARSLPLTSCRCRSGPSFV